MKLWEKMAVLGGEKEKGLRIHESLDELGTDLTDYIAELAETSVKERGVFALALSGGSLISLMGYPFTCSSFLPIFPFFAFMDFFYIFLHIYIYIYFFFLVVEKQKTL